MRIYFWTLAHECSGLSLHSSDMIHISSWRSWRLQARCTIPFFFPDVRDVFGICSAQAWESAFRLLRMIVQGCHYILAICFTCRVEDHDGFRPGAPSHFWFLFSLYFKVKNLPHTALECLFLKNFSSHLVRAWSNSWASPFTSETLDQILILRFKYSSL